DEIRPLAPQLRTQALKPAAEFTIGQGEEGRAGIVEGVCDARVALLREKGIEVNAAAVDLGGGRVLRYTPRGRVADASPGYESKGFFDWECGPPWDAWVCYTDGALLAYVPRLLWGLAQSGMEVDPAECFGGQGRVSLFSLFGIEPIP